MQNNFLVFLPLSQAMPTLIELMKDPSVVVRDTTAWTVGRICEMLPEAAINDIYLAPLLQCLMEGLSAEPRVATNVCWVRNPPKTLPGVQIHQEKQLLVGSGKVFPSPSPSVPPAPPQNFCVQVLPS